MSAGQALDVVGPLPGPEGWLIVVSGMNPFDVVWPLRGRGFDGGPGGTPECRAEGCQSRGLTPVRSAPAPPERHVVARGVNPGLRQPSVSVARRQCGGSHARTAPSHGPRRPGAPRRRAIGAMRTRPEGAVAPPTPGAHGHRDRSGPCAQVKLAWTMPIWNPPWPRQISVQGQTSAEAVETTVYAVVWLLPTPPETGYEGQAPYRY